MVQSASMRVETDRQIFMMETIARLPHRSQQVLRRIHDIQYIGIPAPECIIESNDRHSWGVTQGRQPLGQLPQVDRTGEILRGAIIDETSFATGMIDGSKKAAFAVPGAICAPRPSGTSFKEGLDHPQNNHGLRGNQCFAGSVEWHSPAPYLDFTAIDYQVITMCGRYASFLPAEAIAKIFGTVNPLPNLAPTWNMAPTMDAPVVRLARDGERHLDVLKWGLVPYFTKDMKKARKPINARDDNVAKSGMFKDAFARRRCLVPAPVYYEWRDDPDGKTPFAVARIDGEPVASAAFGKGGNPQRVRSSRHSLPSPQTQTDSCP